MDLPDVQQDCKPKSPRHLQRVGVQGIKMPFYINHGLYVGVEGYHVKATVDLFTDLDRDIKGVSMSRFVRILNKYKYAVLNNKTIKEILENITEKLKPGCTCSYAKFKFDIELSKTSPSSKSVAFEYYTCSFEGRLEGDSYKFFQCVQVPYASYCPCSAELCNHLKEKESSIGFPHAQRSLATVVTQTVPNSIVLEKIIELVEHAVVNIPYPIILREDEMRIAERASKNPMFVEDAAREISEALDKDSRILDWLLKCEHFESIHTHEAVCILSKGISCGLDPGYFLVQI